MKIHIKAALYLTLSVVLVSTLTGCQGSKEVSIYQTGDGGNKPNNENNWVNEGTSSAGGGGNAICLPEEKCYMIESFRIGPQSLASSAKIKEILVNLGKNIPELAGDLHHVLTDRALYMIPINLKKLSSEEIGVFFSTEQAAMQNLKSIYFNRVIFDRMEEQDQVFLSVHEMVMGVRLMQFQSKMNICFAETARIFYDAAMQTSSKLFSDEEVQAFSQKARAKCKEDFPLRKFPFKKIHLNDIDYANVRQLTEVLVEKQGDIPADEWRKWLKAHDFRVYEDAQ